MALKDLIISSFPQYCEKLASGRSVCFRPMTVLEEKSLLLTKQSEDKLSILKTLTNIISNCFENIDVNSFSIAELEQSFLLLRSKSLGEIEQFTIKCPVTNEMVNFQVNLITDLKVNTTKPNPKIKLNSNLLLVLNPPTVKTLLKFPEYDSNSENVYGFIASCVKQINTQKEVINCSDKSEKEIIEFIQNLTPQQFNTIIGYFDSLPTAEIIPEYKTSDGELRKVSIKGIFNFINFFFNHLTLDLFYRQNFQMKYHHNYTLTEIENMIPWERAVYMEQIRKHLNDETNRLNNTTEMIF